MNKTINKRTLTILSIIGLLCGIIGIAMVVYKPFPLNEIIKAELFNINENAEQKELRELLTQAGYADQIDNVAFHVATPIDYSITIKGETYTDVTLYVIVISDVNHKENEGQSDFRKLLVILRNAKAKKNIAYSVFEDFLSNNACTTYSDLKVVVNSIYSLNEKHALSYYIVSTTSCGTQLGGGTLDYHHFFDVDNQGHSNLVLTTSFSSDFNHSDGGTGDRHDVKEVTSISFIKNSNNDFNDIVFDVRHRVSGIEESFSSDTFMEYAFNSTESNYSINSYIRQHGDGVPMSACPELVEEYQAIFSFVGTEYKHKPSEKKNNQNLEEYCWDKLESLPDFKSVVRYLGLEDKLESYLVMEQNSSVQSLSFRSNDYVSLYIIPEKRIVKRDGKHLCIYDIHYVFRDQNTNKVLRKETRKELFTFLTTLKGDYYEPEFSLERVLVNNNYLNNQLDIDGYYEYIARQRFYFTPKDGGKTRVYDNLLYLDGTRESVIMTEMYHADFENTENEYSLKSFGQLEQSGDQYFLKYTTDKGEVIKRPILQPELMINKDEQNNK